MLKNLLLPIRIKIASYIGSGKHGCYLGYIYLKKKGQKLPKLGAPG